MTTVYDEIGEAYRGLAANALDRRHVFTYTVQQAIAKKFGENGLTGRLVFDAGTGGGYWARQFVELGASHVKAVDVSDVELTAARIAGVDRITYHKVDLAQEPTMHQRLFDHFEADFAFAGLVLHYAERVEDLWAMCKHLALNLHRGGTLMALVANPDNPTFEMLDKYRCQTVPCGSPAKPHQFKVTLLDWEGELPAESFDIYHYNRNTYGSALVHAGFKGDITWTKLKVDPAHADDIEPGFWNDYLEKSPIMLMTCTKR